MREKFIKYTSILLQAILTAIFILFVIPQVVTEIFDVKLEFTWNGLSIILVLVSSYYFAICIHELGHLITGWIAGFRVFHSFGVGPLMLIKANDKSLQVKASPYWVAGITSLYMDNKEYIKSIRPRFICYVLGGYLFSGFFLLLSFYILFCFEINSVYIEIFLYSFIVSSVFLFIGDLAFANHYSDSTLLYNAAMKNDKSLIIYIMFYLSCGIRPRDIDLNIQDFNFKEKFWASLANYYTYYYYLDICDIDQALETLCELQIQSVDMKDQAEALYTTVKMESLYKCLLTGDSEKAKDIYREIKDKLIDNNLPCKPRVIASYELLINGDIKKAQEAYQENYIHHNDPSYKGLLILEKDLAKTHKFIVI